MDRNAAPLGRDGFTLEREAAWNAASAIPIRHRLYAQDH